MRRKRKVVPSSGQSRQSFMVEVEVKGESGEAGRHIGGGRGRFIDDSTEGLQVGNQPLNQYLEEGGLGWVVDLRVELEKLDLTELIVSYQNTGRRPYHPRTILGLIVYGFLCGQLSLRDLESLAVRDVGAWWICGGLQPDHSTIGEFVQRHEGVLSEEFYASVVEQLVKRMKLPAGVVAVDGTVMQAAASHHRLLKKDAAEEAARRARVAAEQAPENAKLQAASHKAQAVSDAVSQRTQKQQAKSSGDGSARVAASEPEAVVQLGKDRAYRPAYKPSVLVHESGLIVAQQLHPSSETVVVDDLLDQHRAAFGAEPECALLDAGYCARELLKEMVDRNIDVLCPSGRTEGDWQRKSANPGLFAKSEFIYDEERDAYRCPAQQHLVRQTKGVDRDGRQYRMYAGAACSQCELCPMHQEQRRS